MANGKVGAPIGNSNASKGREWTEALRWALDNYESSSIKRGQALRAIANKVIEQAIEGDKDAYQEIANRLDGKPVQAISGTGPGGEVMFRVVGA